MNKKLIFFDIDGTLLDGETRTVPQSTVKAIREARENGHLTFINSGRTIINIGKIFRDIGFDGYVCGCGTQIWLHGENLHHVSISLEKCREIVDKLREFRIVAFFESEEAVSFDMDSEVDKNWLASEVPKFQKDGCNVEFFANPIEKTVKAFDKFYCVLKEGSKRQEFLEYIEKDFTWIPHGENHIEVIPKGCSKATGISFLCDYFHTSFENCYAIGDSENDMEMLQAVKYGIAMGECSPKILPFCSFQTKKVREDGIYHALKHYNLIS